MKMLDVVVGVIGLYYYQEIFVLFYKFDWFYLMNSCLMKLEDGGKMFINMDEMAKYGDNYVVVFKVFDFNYLLVGMDGGVYESFDLGVFWCYMENLLLMQFYKVVVDDVEFFYNVYGGIQDNSMEGGLFCIDNYYGICNVDWKVVLNWDGYQLVMEFGNLDIMYGQWQQGMFFCIDLKLGEVIDIMLQFGVGEDYECYNWDVFILVFLYVLIMIYYVFYWFWKFIDCGDFWIVFFGDLIRDEEWLVLFIMGVVQSWDFFWDVGVMFNFNIIIFIVVLLKNVLVICIGIDDGLIQIIFDEGVNWNKIEVSVFGVLECCYVNDIKVDLFDESIFYVVLDNYKEGDYKFYLFKMMDKGVIWMAMFNGLGEKNLVWCIVQDYVEKDLMFLGIEFGVYFIVDGGVYWMEMNGGIFIIFFCDFVIQWWENDLVVVFFGRGFYILDDYIVFRSVNKEQLQELASLFEFWKVWWYMEKFVFDFDDVRGLQGFQLFVVFNLDFGVVLIYYLKEEVKSLEQVCKDLEDLLAINFFFFGWVVFEEEIWEMKFYVYLEIQDMEGWVVNCVKVENKFGFNCVVWNLRVGGFGMLMFDGKEQFLMVMLVVFGDYMAMFYVFEKGKSICLVGLVDVKVECLGEFVLLGKLMEEVVVFW